MKGQPNRDSNPVSPSQWRVTKGFQSSNGIQTVSLLETISESEYYSAVQISQKTI